MNIIFETGKDVRWIKNPSCVYQPDYPPIEWLNKKKSFSDRAHLNENMNYYSFTDKKYFRQFKVYTSQTKVYK